MKPVILILVLCFLLGCGGGPPPPPVDNDATIQAAVASTLAAQPTDTPEPTKTPRPEFNSIWNVSQVIEALQDAGLECVDSSRLTREDFKRAPYVVDEAAQFFIPSLCSDCGGRIFTFTSLENLEIINTYFVELGVENPAAVSHIFIQDNVLIQIDGRLPGDQAKLYETALKQMPNDTPLAEPTFDDFADVPKLPTSTVTHSPSIVASQSVNLRNGPGTNYEVVGALSPGQSFNITGRNADSSWWQIAVDGQPVWVAASVVKATNIDQEIEVVEALPPPSTATPIPTQAPTIAPTPTAMQSLPIAPPPAPVCCKVCGANSKACGDSCISLNKQCNKGAGCACEG